MYTCAVEDGVNLVQMRSFEEARGHQPTGHAEYTLINSQTGQGLICDMCVCRSPAAREHKLLRSQKEGGLSSADGTVSLAVALSSMSKPASEVALGRGIPALPKRMVEKMLAWEYIDLADLPPARANVAKDALSSTPNVLLIQSVKMACHHRRLIRNITTWVQCFSIYASVIATKQPQHVPDLMGLCATSSEPVSSSSGLPGLCTTLTTASTWLRLGAKIGRR